MCGIAGVISKYPIEEEAVGKMLFSMRHRGPDDTGYFLTKNASVGMCRLSINDVENGRQPFCNETGSVTVLYNGEIYNAPKLRKILREKGHSFGSRCDGEVIAHLYEEKGENFVSWLDGMFAIFLYDRTEDKFILARDIPGEKPLYYGRLPCGGIVFASEIKAIRAAGLINLSLNRQAIWDMPTFLWVPEPETIFNEIRALPRSTYIVICRYSITEKSYRFAHRPSIDYSNEKDILELTRSLVEDSVRLRVLSDVPVGAFLSGGIDSSIICTLAAQELGELHTFTASLENEESNPYYGHLDESPLAERYAATIGSKHHKVRLSEKSCRQLLDKLIYCADQPFAVSSGLGVLAIAQEAKDHDVRVLLTGDGADELFGGYSWYQHLPPSAAVHSENPATHDISARTISLSKKERRSAIRRHLAPKQAWAWHYYASEEDKRSLFNEEYFSGLIESSLRIFERYKKDRKWDRMDFIVQDRECYLPFEMLRKIDQMTMAFSVEGRSPFVSPLILSHVENLQYTDLIKKDMGKVCLREAFADILPRQIIKRPKHGFNIPIDKWLKAEWGFLLERTFCRGSALYELGIIHQESAEEALRMLHSTTCLYGDVLFCYIILNLWLEELPMISVGQGVIR